MMQKGLLLLAGVAAVSGTWHHDKHCGREKVMLNATIYADNWFEFYFNGKLVKTDPVGFAPHQGVTFDFEAPKSGRRTFVIHAKDFSDDVTGMEYDDKCVGDGGLKAKFSDGTISNSQWKCHTYFYGPLNTNGVPGCIPDFDESYHFTPPKCKVGNKQYPECRSVLTDMPKGWEHKYCPSCTYWQPATEFTDKQVGFGIGPKPGDGHPWGTPDFLDPQTVDWGDAKFIWRPNLNYDNRIICRFSYVA